MSQSQCQNKYFEVSTTELLDYNFALMLNNLKRKQVLQDFKPGWKTR